MVYYNLRETMSALVPTVHYGEDATIVRRTLYRARYDTTPLYVVIVPSGHMFVVTSYVPAMTFEDSCGARVVAVWRDTANVWHAIRQ